MHTTRLPLLLLTALLLSACASIERFQNLMDSQLGKPLAEVQQTFGYNFIERELDGDKTAYTWHWTRTGVTPGYETPTTIYSTGRSRHAEEVIITPGTYFPPTYYEENCEITVIVDGSDTVTAWQARGNGCASYPDPGTALHSGEPPA